jgi:hypothetical protein
VATAGDENLARAALPTVLSYARAADDAARATAWEALLAAADAPAQEAAADPDAHDAPQPNEKSPAAASSSEAANGPETTVLPVDRLKSLVPGEIVTSFFLRRVLEAAAAFALVTKSSPGDGGLAAPAASRPALPPTPEARTEERSRETFWADAEVTSFSRALARQGKSFALIAAMMGCSGRTARRCVAFYYSQWRRLPSFADYRRFRDALGAEGRLDRELMRRDRAWFHFWRFDAAAIGPSLPPAAVGVPDVLKPSWSRRGDDCTAHAMPVSGFVLPILTPPLADTVITRHGDALVVDPKLKPADTAGAVASAVAAAGGTVPRGTFAGVAAVASMSSSSALGPLDFIPMVNDASARRARESLDHRLDLLLQAARGGNRRARRELTAELASVEHVDPLRDLGRVLGAAQDALAKARGNPVGLGRSAHVAGAPSGPLTDAEQDDIFPHPLTDSWVDDRFIDNESFCALCGDGGGMICCDGPCRRSFHVACLRNADSAVRAAIRVSPALQRHKWFSGIFDFERDDWRCFSCISRVNECFVCGISGLADVDVYRCQRLCGKYYHPACLQRYPLTQWLPGHLTGRSLDVHRDVSAEATEDAVVDMQMPVLDVLASSSTALFIGSQSSTVPRGLSTRFVCPFHACAACGFSFSAVVPPVYFRCHACPTAYHAACTPAAAKRDMNEILTCLDARAHSSKQMTEEYRLRSGIARLRPAEDASAQAEAAAARREAFLGSAAAGSRGRIGDVALIRLATSRGSGVLGGARLANVYDWTGIGSEQPAATRLGRPSALLTDIDRGLPADPSGTLLLPSSKPAAIAEYVRSAESPADAVRRASLLGFVFFGPGRLRPGVDVPVRVCHFDAQDAEYYDEILRRAAEVSASLDASAPLRAYVGVKPVVLKGSVSRFGARISVAQILRHLGTFSSPLEAAVAYDYASTYVRGHTAATINFPGSASDCRVRAPLDPWPPGAVSNAQESSLPQWCPKAGEEGVLLLRRVLPGESSPLTASACAAAARLLVDESDVAAVGEAFVPPPLPSPRTEAIDSEEGDDRKVSHRGDALDFAGSSVEILADAPMAGYSDARMQQTGRDFLAPAVEAGAVDVEPAKNEAAPSKSSMAAPLPVPGTVLASLHGQLFDNTLFGATELVEEVEVEGRKKRKRAAAGPLIEEEVAEEKAQQARDFSLRRSGAAPAATRGGRGGASSSAALSATARKSSAAAGPVSSAAQQASRGGRAAGKAAPVATRGSGTQGASRPPHSGASTGTRSVPPRPMSSFVGVTPDASWSPDAPAWLVRGDSSGTIYSSEVEAAAAFDQLSVLVSKYRNFATNPDGTSDTSRRVCINLRNKSGSNLVSITRGKLVLSRYSVAYTFLAGLGLGQAVIDDLESVMVALRANDPAYSTPQSAYDAYRQSRDGSSLPAKAHAAAGGGKAVQGAAGGSNDVEEMIIDAEEASAADAKTHAAAMLEFLRKTPERFGIEPIRSILIDEDSLKFLERKRLPSQWAVCRHIECSHKAVPGDVLVPIMSEDGKLVQPPSRVGRYVTVQSHLWRHEVLCQRHLKCPPACNLCRFAAEHMGKYNDPAERTPRAKVGTVESPPTGSLKPEGGDAASNGGN